LICVGWIDPVGLLGVCELPFRDLDQFGIRAHSGGW
jgi:hypothetical protein